jgi:hypothetical protein
MNFLTSGKTIPAALLSVFVLMQNPEFADSRKQYRPTGLEAALVGSVTLLGKRPAPLRIDTSADPICGQVNSNPQTESLEGKEGRLENVFVYLKNNTTLETYSFPIPTTQVVLERKACRYVPHVLGLRLGQPLSIQNNDPTHHNTHPTPKNNVEWNQTQPPGSAPIIKTFTRHEVLIPFKCNQHPWERAYVGVLDHPFFSVSDEEGNYSIHGIPPGSYTVVAWHERLGEKIMDTTFVPGEFRHIEFTFDAVKQ